MDTPIDVAPLFGHIAAFVHLDRLPQQIHNTSAHTSTFSIPQRKKTLKRHRGAIQCPLILPLQPHLFPPRTVTQEADGS